MSRLSLFHVAETREQAHRDVEFGIEQWFRYFQKVAAFPQMAVGGLRHTGPLGEGGRPWRCRNPDG